MHVYLLDLIDALNSRGIPVEGDFKNNLSFNRIQWLRPRTLYEPETLYVCPAAGGGPTTYLRLHSETFRLEYTDPEKSYELLTDLFEVFNNWESRMIEAVLQGRNVRSFLQLASEVFHCPLMLTDANLNLIDRSDCAELDIQQIQVFLQVDSALASLHTELSNNLTDFRDSLPEAETHVLCAALWHGRQLLGHLYFYHFRGEVHEGVVYRIQEVTKLLSSLLAVNADQYFSITYISSVLSDVAHGRFTAWSRLQAELRAVGWQRGHRLRMAVFGGCPDAETLTELQETLLGRSLPCHLFSEPPDLVLFGNESLEPQLLQQLENLLPRLDFYVGMGASGTFYSLQDIPVFYRQARFAQRIAARRHTVCETAQCYAVDAMRESLSENPTLRDWAHPDLVRLREYDAQHGTQLFETLACHLLHGCRCGETAQRLVVHPNTVRYRLVQMEPLLSGSLYDPDYREVLLFSLLVS